VFKNIWTAIKENQLDYTNFLFLILNPLLTGCGLVYYFQNHDFNIWILLFTLIYAILTNLSITAGYHRHFAHKSYDTNSFVQFLYLFIGASGFQGSALKWSSDHRRHHRFEDTEQDPYSIHRGFFHAHVGWLFDKKYVAQSIQAPDLEKLTLVAHQHRHYLLWSIVAGYLFPTFIGFLFGDALGGLLIGGGLRIFLTQQSTFFVNSICHYIGRKTYCHKISARDSWFVALLTHGEGYHNFHHKFQIDYRNGIRWYHWDPTKWTIQFLALIGFAKKLRTVPKIEILRARLSAEAELQKRKGLSETYLQELREKVLQAQLKIQAAQEHLQSFKKEYAKKREELLVQGQVYRMQYQQKLLELKSELEKAKIEFNFALQQWRCLELAKV